MFSLKPKWWTTPVVWVKPFGKRSPWPSVLIKSCLLVSETAFSGSDRQVVKKHDFGRFGYQGVYRRQLQVIEMDLGIMMAGHDFIYGRRSDEHF